MPAHQFSQAMRSSLIFLFDSKTYLFNELRMNFHQIKSLTRENEFFHFKVKVFKFFSNSINRNINYLLTFIGEAELFKRFPFEIFKLLSEGFLQAMFFLILIIGGLFALISTTFFWVLTSFSFTDGEFPDSTSFGNDEIVFDESA